MYNTFANFAESRVFFKTHNFSGSPPAIKSFHDGFHKAALNPERAHLVRIHRSARMSLGGWGRAPSTSAKILFLIPEKIAPRNFHGLH